MASFDPAAATSQYLATLDPAVVARAQAYTQGQHWLLIASKILAIIVCVLLLRSGLLRRVGDRISSKRSMPNLATFGAAAAFLAAQWLLLSPLNAYSGWYRERAFGLSDQTLAGWFSQSVVQGLLNAVLGAVLLTGLFAMIRRTRLWWAWSSGLAGLVGVLAVAVLPALVPTSSGYRALPDGKARSAIERLAASVGLQGEAVKVFRDEGHPNRYTASVTGIGTLRTIAVSDAVLHEPLDVPAVRAVVAHEIGHYRHGHLIILGLLVAVLASVGLFVADRSFDRVARMMSGRAVPPAKGDVGAIPVLLAIAAAFALVTTPVVNAGMRAVEVDADGFGLDLAREPDGAARGLLATVDYRAPSPSRLEEVLFYDHPSIARRIRTAMDWMAQHRTAP
jgi:STE24 endopeptidase